MALGMRGAERQDSAPADLDSAASMGTLILARHSTTEASAAGRNLGRRTDPPLAAAGVDLAARLGTALGAELAELPNEELRLLTSPALRCRQTATAVAERVSVTGDVE